MSKKDQLPEISDDAKMLLACTFMLGMTGLNYKMVEGKPSDRAQVALDELVAKKVLIKESINMAGGIGFKPRGYDLSSLKPWFNKNKNGKARASLWFNLFKASRQMKPLLQGFFVGTAIILGSLMAAPFISMFLTWWWDFAHRCCH